jgi:hypothetical protein
VPAVWPLEVSNALIVLRRRGNISKNAATTAADLLGSLVITVHQDRLTIPPKPDRFRLGNALGVDGGQPDKAFLFKSPGHPASEFSG